MKKQKQNKKRKGGGDGEELTALGNLIGAVSISKNVSVVLSKKLSRQKVRKQFHYEGADVPKLTLRPNVSTLM